MCAGVCICGMCMCIRCVCICGVCMRAVCVCICGVCVPVYLCVCGMCMWGESMCVCGVCPQQPICPFGSKPLVSIFFCFDKIVSREVQIRKRISNAPHFSLP